MHTYYIINLSREKEIIIILLYIFSRFFFPAYSNKYSYFYVRDAIQSIYVFIFN
jgi:hypothetical protein